MLLNNFKKLISFYGGHKFINVSGDEVNKEDFLLKAKNSCLINNHSINSSATKFDYTTTTGSNDYINEQETYLWNNIVSNSNYYSADEQYNGFTLFIGTGDKEVEPDDFCLDNSLSISVTAASCLHYPDEKTIVSRTFYNNTDEDVIINEVGCYIFAFQGHTYNTGGYPVVMIGRKVLNNPVVIPVGEQYTFNYTIDMSRISFEEADN